MNRRHRRTGRPPWADADPKGRRVVVHRRADAKPSNVKLRSRKMGRR